MELKVFTYGTLMTGMRNNRELLSSQLVMVEEAIVPGRLYNVTDYGYPSADEVPFIAVGSKAYAADMDTADKAKLMGLSPELGKIKGQVFTYSADAPYKAILRGLDSFEMVHHNTPDISKFNRVLVEVLMTGDKWTVRCTPESVFDGSVELTPFSSEPSNSVAWMYVMGKGIAGRRLELIEDGDYRQYLEKQRKERHEAGRT